jgi:predicted extracellular nuclease
MKRFRIVFLFLFSGLYMLVPAQTLRSVADIQGAGSASPYSGQALKSGGIVTAVFTASNQIGGFFMQNTLRQANQVNGIFIYTGSSGYGVAVGDSVVVTGSVAEYNNRTEINATGVSIVSHANPVPVVEVSFPGDFSLGWESFEGMNVRFKQTLTVTSNNNLKNGQLSLSSQRLYIPTNQFPALSAGALALAASNNGDQFTLASGNTSFTTNPFADPATGVRRTGEKADNLTGVVDQVGTNYYVYPSQTVQFYGNPRTAAPGSVGDCTLKVCGYNMEYYLTSSWGTGLGAANQTQFNQQHSKLLKVLMAIDADIYGLAEIQSGQDAVSYMTSAMNTAAGSQLYAYVNDGTDVNGTYTKVGFIYRKDKVVPYGKIQEIGPLSSGLKSRMMVQGFTYLANGERFIFSMNHYKAKGCSGSTGLNADQGDGQGCYNSTRVSQSQALVNNMPYYQNATYFNDNDVLVMGDLNSYAMEDPIDTIVSRGYTDLLRRYEGTTAYSYMYSGQAGYIDQALASPSLYSQVTGATVWHIDSDEPEYVGYDSSAWQDNPYRSSDHDPVVVGLSLRIASGISDPAIPSAGIVYSAAERLLKIRNAQQGMVEIIDISGRRVFQKQFVTADPAFSLSLSGGVYIVKVSGGAAAVTKIIVP